MGTEFEDAARYRWIRKNAVWRTGYREQSVTWDVYMPEPDIREGKLHEDSVAQELDAAIDKAMNSGEGAAGLPLSKQTGEPTNLKEGSNDESV